VWRSASILRKVASEVLRLETICAKKDILEHCVKAVIFMGCFGTNRGRKARILNVESAIRYLIMLLY
jgi:hypothetical protein